MALETKLVQKLSQSLLMTPQLQQAIKLLQLGRLEYKEALEKELLENPILEEAPGEKELSIASSHEHQDSPEAPLIANGSDPSDSAYEEAPSDREKSPDWENYIESLSDSRDYATPKGTFDFEDRPQVEATLTKAKTLQDYIVEQIRLLDLTDEEKSIIVQIVGNLDKDGYLECTLEEIAEETNSDPETIKRSLAIVRTLDPPGVAASCLGECLLIQLENLGLGEGLAASIIQKHLEKLEKRKFEQIAKEEKVEVNEVYQAVSIIRTLEPRPGRPFSDDSTRYVIPDIYVQKVGIEWVITLNDEGLPRLRISPYYLDILRNEESSGKINKAYLNERLKAASWLIKSIHQRQQTIYRVTESIVKFQKEFLEHGIERLKPLVLKDVADDIGMHESTVSRVTTNKYVHTPQGVFELKYFFSNGIRTATGSMSSSSIKEKIRTLIASENSNDPISDQKIVEILQKENIEIARRTVAKYREGLGICSSSQRKKSF